jgi:hypothetical protein
MAIQKPNYFVMISNGLNKMATENSPVLGWSVPAEIDHWKIRLVRFSNVYSTIFLLNCASE